jgi:GrpB-like predicted nucleotidyltransferase (UPF0157 family)
MDPITAITTATAAFNTVKKMVQMGRDVEDTLGQVGKWYGAIADLNEAERIAKNPPLFKKIVASKSVEEEAMNVYAAQKKAEQQERELRELLMYTYGPKGYQELVDLRRRIKNEREKTIYAQARRRKDAFWLTVQSTAILFMSGLLYQIFMMLYTSIQAVNNA